MKVLTDGHNSEQVSKRVRCAGSLQMEITTESPRLPWLVRQCDVAGEVRQKRTAPDLVLWSDEPGGLLEPAQEGGKERSHLVQVQRRRPRTSSRTQVPETTAACEPELLTIHITDNHTKSLEHLQELQGRAKFTSEVRKLEEKAESIVRELQDLHQTSSLRRPPISVGKVDHQVQG